MTDAFSPVLLADLELSEPIEPVRAGHSPVTAIPYGAAALLVRLHGDPLGIVTLPLTDGCLSAATVARAVQAELGDRIAEHLAADGLPPRMLPLEGYRTGPELPRCLEAADLVRTAAGAPVVSVVVATFRRPELVVRCVSSLLASDYPNFEVLVVDNSPDRPDTCRALAPLLAADSRVRYLVEPDPGVARARNRGIAESRGEVVIFTDDDAAVDPGWISAHVAAFANPDVTAVSGLTHPLELETSAQAWFEHFAGFARGHRRLAFVLDEATPPTMLWPYTCGAVGSGVNFSARTAVLRRLGGFDTRLGPGTGTTGGEDLDLALRLLLDGGQITYEPRALLRHQHRRDPDILQQQIFSYGIGAVAMLTKWWLADRRLRRLVLTRLGRIARLSVTPPRAERSAGKPAPRSLLLWQLRGYLLGPLRWLAVVRERPEPLPLPPPWPPRPGSQQYPLTAANRNLAWKEFK